PPISTLFPYTTLFRSEFNTGGVQVPLTYTNGKGYGWNLVGNPYSASIDWTLLKVIENSQNIEDNFWVWMPTQRAYGAYSASTTRSEEHTSELQSRENL